MFSKGTPRPVTYTTTVDCLYVPLETLLECLSRLAKNDPKLPLGLGMLFAWVQTDTAVEQPLGQSKLAVLAVLGRAQPRRQVDEDEEAGVAAHGQ